MPQERIAAATETSVRFLAPTRVTSNTETQPRLQGVLMSIAAACVSLRELGCIPPRLLLETIVVDASEFGCGSHIHGHFYGKDAPSTTWS